MKNSISLKINYTLIKCILIGFGISIGICSLMLFIFSAFINLIGIVPEEFLNILTLFSAIIGVFIGSYIAVKILKEKGYLLGGLIGLFFSIVLIIISLSLNNYTNITDSLTKIFSIIISGIISGIISINKKKKFKI